MTYREGWGGENSSFTATYVNNKRVGLTYDAAGNLINDGGYNFTYDVTGEQATASSAGYLLEQYYDGDGLRVKKKENNAPTYYLRSSVLGGQVVAEINGAGGWQRGYVYLGGELVAVQQGGVYWVHQDPLVKSKRVSNASGTVVSALELDPWGGNTNRSSNYYFQPHVYNTYERDNNGADEAMFRRYNRWWSRFDQPDPYAGSYDLGDPQSFNRYASTSNDPVNFVDPTGLEPIIRHACPPGFWGGGSNVNDRRSSLNPSGRDIIANAEPRVAVFVFDFAENLLAVQVQPSMFNRQSSTFWWGFFFQGPVPQPHPTPTPRPNKPSNFSGCFNGWRFSATVDYFTQGSRLNGAARVTAQVLEIGPPISLAGDAGATAFKATRTGIGGTTNRYASGLNFFFRHTADASVKGSLIKFGTKATPILSGIGAFTGGYNLAMAAQCGLGVIE
jgi:RHS repeat-associated protein